MSDREGISDMNWYDHTYLAGTGRDTFAERSRFGIYQPLVCELLTLALHYRQWGLG